VQTAPAPMQSRTYAQTSIVLLCLLGMTTLYYVVAGRRTEAMDSVTWYILLILFLVEAFRLKFAQSARALQLIRLTRAAAIFVLVLTLGLYLRERQWVDAINMTLWLSVVALMELEVRRPTLIEAHPKAFSRTAACLYLGLALVVLLWLFQRKWIDAWDAVLWLAAFGALELNLLARGAGEAGDRQGGASPAAY
jgi:hypothetical protein